MSNARVDTVTVPSGRILHVQEIRATVTRACPHCAAPNIGGSHSEPWQCQECGKERPADEIPGDNGLLWRREIKTKGFRLWPWK